MQNSEWSNYCQHIKDKWPVYVSDYDTKDDVLGINIYRFLEVLNSHMTENTIVVTDAGSASYALPQNLKAKLGQRFVFSASQADMGCAIPAGIGVALAAPEKTVVVVTGDGSFNSNIQELASIKQHNLSLKIFVLNNSGYLSIRNTQRKFFENRVYGVDKQSGLWFPSLHAIAQAYRINYTNIFGEFDLKSQVADVLKRDVPYIIDINCLHNQEIVPTQMLKEVNGKKVQAALDDMYPFISDDEYNEEKEKVLSICKKL
jgi:acetolactate synthase I/II/III large subunit